eukprot:CAMPEP_0176440358 /NCGR_PEP_ID=MMETSP0127-20121128/20524_1 /TAXON_ID=938130 /ORGANISM="Platyophrya macrostoma, Strain WH" /LENGTH=566 /DNA_ID=CAMNT_0017824869 /DNA_START=83 /DNA_END=1783 /DNA_ORIENTATION=-
MRKTKVTSIFQKEEKTSDDLNFVDHYITTYLPELSKTLKSKFPKAAYEKIYSNFKYQKLSSEEEVFNKQNWDKTFYYVLSGKLVWNGVKKSSDEGAASEKIALESFNKNSIVSHDKLKASVTENSGKYDDLCCNCAEESEVISISVETFERIGKEFEDQAKSLKILSLSKVFGRFKKLDKSTKEDLLKHFKEVKLAKGTIAIKGKSKIEEIYTIQKGKVALVQKNDFNTKYEKEFVIFGILDKDSSFNEYPLVLDKENPYYVVCTEDVEVLVLDKSGYDSVVDNDTSNELRANSSCKERLQNTILEKFSRFSQEEATCHQNKFLKQLGVDYKTVEEIISKKNTQSNQFQKNLDKFNASFGKQPAASDPKAKFSEFATPRLVSKDPRFAALDPQRQLSLMALRNEGLNRRSGDTATTTTSIMKNPEQLRNVQKNLLNEEKGVAKLLYKKNVSEIKSLATEEESKGGNTILGKFSRKNDDLLAKITKPGETTTEATQSSGSTDTTTTESTTEPVKTDGGEEASVKFDKKVEDGDKFGLELTKRNLVKPVASDNINKKRINLLGKPGMI